MGKYVGENNPMYGKHHRPETIEKLRMMRIKYYQEHPGIQSGENNPMWGEA